jgi:LmbE family N-acetylglucosaminyl deacetylase
MMSMATIRRVFAGLPVTQDVLQGRRALVLSPHQDDESLGAGGLIAKAAAAGDPPVLVWLTDGAASHPGSLHYAGADLRALREAEALAAAALLGVPAGHCHFLRHPDAAMPAAGLAFDAALDRLTTMAADHACGVIVAAWGFDPHCDHEAGAALARALAARTGLALLFYPVWGLLRADADELPITRIDGWRLDIRDELTAKRAAIAAHRSQAGLVVTDSPDGFIIPERLLAACTGPTELYLSA